jgi:hypothetical protein
LQLAATAHASTCSASLCERGQWQPAQQQQQQQHGAYARACGAPAGAEGKCAGRGRWKQWEVRGGGAEQLAVSTRIWDDAAAPPHLWHARARVRFRRRMPGTLGPRRRSRSSSRCARPDHGCQSFSKIEQHEDGSSPIRLHACIFQRT